MIGLALVLGAILAVVLLYRHRIVELFLGLIGRSGPGRRLLGAQHAQARLDIDPQRRHVELVERARDQAVHELAERVEAAQARTEEARAQAVQAAEEAERARRDSERAREETAAAGRERDQVLLDLRLERARLEDLRAELEASRAEAERLRERAVAAELRNR